MDLRPVRKPDFDGSPAQLDRIIRGHWVGRAREFENANLLWQRVVSGQGQVLTISGEPGVGKTRFVQELASAAHLAGARVMTGECFNEGSAPYAPLAQMIREVLESSDLTGLNLPNETLRDLMPIIPSLRSRLTDILLNQNLDVRGEQERVFEGFIGFCSTLISQGPLLLFIDDVHWADIDTLLLLKNLARRGRKLPLLIVMTFREAELASTPVLNEVLVDLNRERLAVHLMLEPLSREETGDLLAAFFAEEVTADFLEAIFRQTEGNPFFIEEVCKGLIDAGQLSFSEGRWHRPAMAAIKIPQTVRAAIQARIEKLPDYAQEALRMAAIIGSDFDFDTLKTACDLDEEILIKALESAIRAQLIAETQQSGSATTRFSFVHVIIPTTLRESVIHVRRRRLHHQAAQAIEAVHPDDFESLAYQYAEAGDVESARNYFLRAGDRAKPTAPGEAARFYRAALDRWPDNDQIGRAEILARLGYCLWVIGDVQGSQSIYETAYTLFDLLGNRTQSGEMQRMIGRMYWERADRASALQHYHNALTILEQGSETVELARAISSISQMHMLAPDEDQAIVWGERALILAKRLGAEDVVVHALNNIGTSHAQSGNFEKGLTILQESLQRALAAGLPLDACRAYYNSGVMLQRQCRYKNAKDIFVELYNYATRVYAKTYANLALWRLMWIHWITGQWGAALAYRAQMVQFSDSIYASWAKRIFGLIYLDLGRIEDARRELEECMTSALRANDLQTTVPHLGLLARAYDALGQEAKTAEMINQTLEFVSGRNYLSDESIMPLLISGQWLAARTNPKSLEDAQACQSQLERHAKQYHTEEATASLFETKGYVCFAEGHPLKATENFRQAAANWELIDRLYDQARALGSLGRALTITDDWNAAKAANNQAVTIFNTLAAHLEAEHKAVFLNSPLVREVRQAAEALTLKTPRKTAGQEFNGLTEREIQVLKLVAQGLTNAQIAEQLVLSPLTVNAHLRSIFKKLDVTSRTAAARQAIDMGLV